MRTSRFSWKMRTTAIVTMSATAIMQLWPTGGFTRPMEEKRRVPIEVGMKPGQTQCLTPEQWKKVDAQRTQAQQKADVRPLTSKELRSLHGRGQTPPGGGGGYPGGPGGGSSGGGSGGSGGGGTQNGYRNKYLNGMPPWQRSLRDVNLCTGNLLKSFTDFQIAPGRGAGLALQRTYNSNDPRVGAFGVGWTHAYDIRMKEESNDPPTDDSMNFSDRDDFCGGKRKYHRDADGLYSPPSYLFDELNSDYYAFLVNGPIDVEFDTDISMDGTIKHYIKNGDERDCDYIKDRYGNTTTLTYGQSVTIGGITKNLLTQVTDPSGRHLNFTWSNLGTAQQPAWRITEVDGPLYSVAYTYGADFNLSGVTLDPNGLHRTTTYTYTSYSGQNGTETGLLASVTDPMGHVVSYNYTVAPLGNIWVSGINEPAGVNGTLAWSISSGYNYGAGQGATWFYGTVVKSNINQPNVSLNLTVAEDANLRCTALMTNYPSQNYGVTSDARGIVMSYDSANNMASKNSVSNCMGFTSQSSGTTEVAYVTMTYGPHGNVLTQSAQGFPNETTTTTYYNASQYFQKKSVTDALGHTTTFIVGDNQGNDPTGQQATSNGNKGSILYVQDPGYNIATSPSYQKQLVNTYNQYGQKASETNLNGTVTQYTCGDSWGNVTQMIQDPGSGHLNRTTSMVYDAAGHVLSSTDPNGQTTTFAYNAVGQPVTAQFPPTANTPAETVSYTYGANGRMESVSNHRGLTALTYENGCDRVQSVTDPVTGTLSYTYGLHGERASMTLPGGGTWTYQYPPTIAGTGGVLSDDHPDHIMRRLTSIFDDQGRRFEIQLFSDGHPFQVRTNETFDSSQNLLSYVQTNYTYDASGIYTNFWTLNINNNWNWKDANGQWHQSTVVSNQYTYDLIGQRLSNQISDVNGPVRTEQYGYDELNRLTTVNYGDGQTQSYTFDPMGNRLSKTDNGGGINGTESYTYNAANMLLSRAGNAYTNDANGNTLTGGGRTNTWDSQNRLVQCVNGANTSVFTYGADGLRHRSVVNGTTTDFVLDTSMCARELHNGGSVATYFVGARGPEYRRDDTNGTLRWYVYDGLGSVVGEIDPSGNVTSSRKYDVYGGVRGGNNPGGTSKQKFVGSLGHPSEDETGFIYMRARYMDPAIGRFITQDPAFEGDNWFVYVGSAPTNKRDFTGKYVGVLGSTYIGMQWEVSRGGEAIAVLDFALAFLATVLLTYTIIQAAALDGVMLSQSEAKRIGEIFRKLTGRNITPEEREKIHREIGREKIGSGDRSNPDLDWETIEEIIQDVVDSANQ